MYNIRAAKKEDALQLLKIYAPYVEETAITFEYDVPTLAEFKKRIADTLKKYPYIVAEDGGKIIGYAYASAFKERAAYDWAIETSVYVDKDCRKNGVGKALYLALEDALAKQNIINLNACIAYPAEKEDGHLTADSVKFHEHMGYTLVGRFHKCGYKFGRWYDMVWMEKHIGEHPDTPAPVKAFPEISL